MKQVVYSFCLVDEDDKEIVVYKIRKNINKEFDLDEFVESCRNENILDEGAVLIKAYLEGGEEAVKEIMNKE